MTLESGSGLALQETHLPFEHSLCLAERAGAPSDGESRRHDPMMERRHNDRDVVVRDEPNPFGQMLLRPATSAGDGGVRDARHELVEEAVETRRGDRRETGAL